MYYTGKGDSGTTKLFSGQARISKSEPIFALLGSLDELNSYLGLASVAAHPYRDIYQEIRREQEHLFICQAHFAKADTKIPADLLSELEARIAKISQLIRPRKSFVIPGGSYLSATLDIARTLARKCERYALSLSDKEKADYNQLIFVYLNRLSSFFYVLARYANDLAQVDEGAPQYK